MLVLLVLSTVALSGADVRTLVPVSSFVRGGEFPTFLEWQLEGARAGETLTIAFTAGDDNTGDGGMKWRVDDNKALVKGKGLAKAKEKVVWKVPMLVVEGGDTNVRG